LTLLDPDDLKYSPYKNFSEESFSQQFAYLVSSVILVVAVQIDINQHIHSLVFIINGCIDFEYGKGTHSSHHIF